MRPFTFPPQLPSISFQPLRYRQSGIGYWSGHIPFACDLVATLRPQTLVELGSHMGESYFAFCQSIVENGVNCRAFAVDTWSGDQHTGSYDELVYRDVAAHNQAHYGQFSTLLRMTFDEAASRFGEASIDLLHIDGAHTYEAVSHDFLNWWSKVKPGGVVLLHDSFERRDSFGVYILLEELRTAGIPAGEFFHSHGLGVLVKTPVAGNEHVAAAFVTADDDLRRQMRNYYEVCAGNLLGRFLLDKQSRPGEWEVTSQVFWRTAGQPFTEPASVRLAHVVGAKPSDAVLHVPPSSEPYEAFRLALNLDPALVELFAIEVEGNSGESLWSREAASGVLFLGTHHEALMDLPLPADVCAELSRQGGQVCVRMAGVDPMTLGQKLAAAGHATS